jgi:hypothetical protein
MRCRRIGTSERTSPLFPDVAGRAGPLLCSYLDLRLARSLSFGVSLLALVSACGGSESQPEVR